MRILAFVVRCSLTHGTASILPVAAMTAGLMVAAAQVPPAQRGMAEATASTEARLRDSAPVRFWGEVRRGEIFQKEIGHDLVFRLLTSQFGWFLQVVESQSPDRDYSAVATPPFRGINPLQINGWHFRNGANTGPNDGGLNAPQAGREFAFYVRKADYEKGLDCLKKLLWSGDYSEEQVKTARKICRDLRSQTAEGTLTILDLELGNLVPGQQAWIDFMKFDVELRAPQAATP